MVGDGIACLAVRSVFAFTKLKFSTSIGCPWRSLPTIVKRAAQRACPLGLVLVETADRAFDVERPAALARRASL